MLTVSKPDAQTLNLNSANAAVVFSVRDATAAAMDLTVASGTWGSAVVTFERSIDGTNYYGFGTPTVLIAAGAVDLKTDNALWVRARVSTVAGGAGTATVNLLGKGP